MYCTQQRDVDRADEDLQRQIAKEKRAKEKADSEAIRLKKRTKKKKHEVGYRYAFKRLVQLVLACCN
jgi:hypothetical protein